MSPVSVIGLLLLIDGVLSKQLCSKQDVLEYINLTRSNEKFTTCRPVLDWTQPTIVYFDIHLFGILSMIEKSQIFVPLIWMSVRWNNDRISWDPEDFCGIKHVVLPKELLWVPDLFINEAVEKEDGPMNPYLTITYDGNVTMDDDHKMVSTCAMNVHKFPFDTQTCHITVFSVNHPNSEIKLVPASNSSKVTQMARDNLLTQGEWELLNISIFKENVTYEDQTYDRLKYTITLRRMPLMYFINFQLPVLIFLVLDLASFFIPDRSEKLSFKVTVLLAMSVLLLILNDILPSKSHKCPLIATYVIAIFTFMLLSLLETILVIYLLNVISEHDTKGVQSPGDHNSETDTWKGDSHDRICSSKVESLEMYSNEKAIDVHLLQLILEELQAIKHTLVPHTLKGNTLHNQWLRLVTWFNRGFFVVYLISVTVFLCLIVQEWEFE